MIEQEERTQTDAGNKAVYLASLKAGYVRCSDLSISSSQIDYRQYSINGYLRVRTLTKNVSHHKRHIIRLEWEVLIAKQDILQRDRIIDANWTDDESSEDSEYVPEENTV